MSIAGSTFLPMTNMVQTLTTAGIVVVSAAGNAAQNACNFSPGSAATSITVGATTSADLVSYYSNFGPCVDVYAPGSVINSVLTGSVTGYITYSGTSMAAPHVAGTAALIFQINPKLTVAQVGSMMFFL
jgi:subtilisin family serine protease